MGREVHQYESSDNNGVEEGLLARRPNQVTDRVSLLCGSVQVEN